MKPKVDTVHMSPKQRRVQMSTLPGLICEFESGRVKKYEITAKSTHPGLCIRYKQIPILFLCVEYDALATLHEAFSFTEADCDMSFRFKVQRFICV